MNSFDDMLPEEHEPQYQELTTMLQQVSRKPAFVAPDRQARMLAEVRGLLEITASERVAGQEDRNIAQFHAPQLGGVSRQHRLSRLVTFIAAVLVIGALIVTDLLIFHPWFSSTSRPRPPVPTSRPRPPVRPDRFVISSTYPIAKDYSLNGVAALSKNDIWVIGDNPIRRPPRPQAMFKHWNGSQWVIYPDPASVTQTVTLRAIAAASPNDVWAVGSVEGPDQYQSLIEHWNGSRWSVVPSPTFGGPLVSVTAISAHDAWAVGIYQHIINVTEPPLIEHWDGTRWSMISSPHPGIGSILTKVKAISANNIWAVGSFGNGSQEQTLIVHWDGSQWSIVKSPSPGKVRNELSSITVVSPQDIWSVGLFTNSGQRQFVEEPFTMHWDGAKWSIVESPGFGKSTPLSDVAALSANDVWAVGYENDNSGPLIEHWDGAQWSIVKSPGSGTVNALYGMDRVPHSNTIIVVGTTYYSTGETGTVLYITSLGGDTH